MQAQEHKGSCDGLCQAPALQNWVPRTQISLPQTCATGEDAPTVCFGYTSCTDAHSCSVEDIGFLQSKVVAFCQEAFIGLLTALHGQRLILCQGSDVASCFQIVDTTHLRSDLDLCPGRAAGEIYCIQRSNFIYPVALDTEIPHSFMGFFPYG